MQGVWGRERTLRVLQTSPDGGRSPEPLQGLSKGLPEKPSARSNSRDRAASELEAARKSDLARNLKKWRQENPSKAAAQRNRNRAMRLECEGHYTAAEFKALCEEYGNVCLRCGDKDAPLTPDHVVPLSLGSSNWISNIQPLCRRCNSRKNIKIIDYRLG